MSRITFYNFNLFDGKENKIVNNAWLTVDDKIGKIISRGESTPPQFGKRIDLKGKYVLPGLIDAHCHIATNPEMTTINENSYQSSETELAIYAYQNLRTFLKSGVTFGRGCGTSYDIDIKLNKMTKADNLKDIPGFLPSGRAFSMTGGHGDAPHLSFLVDSQNEMRKNVRTALKNGAKIIKMMATGGVMSPQDNMINPQLSVKEMRTGVVEAHHKGIKVAAHAQANPGIQNALDAGVDSIEHGCYVTKNQASQMVKQGTYLTPTLTAPWSIEQKGHKVLPSWEFEKNTGVLEDMIRNFKVAYKIGVEFTCGTDSGSPFNFFDKTPIELELLTRIGMSPFEALQCSYINSAKLCGIEKDHGTLEVGKYADFQVLDNDPLVDIKAVQQKDKQVYLHGKREF